MASKPPTRRGRLRLGSAEGSMLVEVLIGTIVLAIVTAAVLNGLDGAQATGRANKDRSVSAALAQQDIERLRALPIVALAGLKQTRSVDVNGLAYTVESTTAWMRDDSTELSCVDDTSQAAYLKLTSSASSPASSDRPVTESTLITPPAAFSSTTGTATVKTTDRDGAPLAGVGVQLSGPSSYSATTNELGCAIFSFIEPGDYTATVPGNLVSWNGERPANVAVSVIAGKATPAQLELEAPTSLRVSLKTPGGASAAWTSVSVPHPNLPGGFKLFTAGSPQTLIDATDLFPQKDGYGVYAGSCEANNPANPFWGDPEYFSTHPQSHADTDPGASLVAVDAVMPVLELKIVRQRNREVWLRIDQTDHPNEDVDCRWLGLPRQRIGPRTSTSSGSSGRAAEDFDYSVALPFGNYRICIDDNDDRSRSTTVALTSPTTVTWSSPRVDLRSAPETNDCGKPSLP